MKLLEGTVTIETPDGPMGAFQVVPDDGSRMPAIVVCQEAFGVNTHIMEVCRRFAREGYVALAPDMYHRSGRLLTYAYDDPGRRQPFSVLTNSGMESDINLALDYLTALPQVDAARIGTVGFCVGGFMAFLAACRTRVATAVCFYGGGIVNSREGLRLEPVLPEAARIGVPVLCLFGELDASIPPPEVEAIKKSLASASRGHEVVIYPGAQHGFFCDERSSYKPDAAADAWRRTVNWLELRLKAQGSRLAKP